MQYRLRRHRGKFVAVRYENGQRRRIALGTSSEAEAWKLIADLERETTKARRWTVGELWEDYAAHKKLERLAYAWKSLGPTFKDLEPDHVTQALCQTYAEGRAEAGASNGTIHTELLFLSAALNHAEKAGRIGRAPHIWKPQKPPPRDRRLSRMEARALIDATPSPHVALAIKLALGTGARIGAILDLTWARVDFEGGVIELHNPDREATRKGRATVPMNNMVREALEEAHKGAVSDYVIEYGGKPVGSIKTAFRAACKRAGLKGVTPHVLRHTAASWMAEAGIPMDEIAQYLGHSDSRTTYKVYARYSPGYLRKASEALEI